MLSKSLFLPSIAIVMFEQVVASIVERPISLSLCRYTRPPQRPLKMKQQGQSQTQSISKRRVRFPTNQTDLRQVVCLLPHCHDLDPEESAMIWYTKSDLQQGRADAKLLSRQCSNEGHSKFLDGTFCEKSAEAQEKLLSWTSRGGSSIQGTRGLERWANKIHSEIRQDDQFKAIMAVLEAQDSMVTFGDGPLDWDKVKKIYQKSSKNARHFARMIGKADSYAVTPELRLSSKLSSLRNSSNRDNCFCDTDSVVTTATTKTDTSVSPPKKIQTYLRIIRSKDTLELLESSSSTHSVSPLKRFRMKIQGKKPPIAAKRLTDEPEILMEGQ